MRRCKKVEQLDYYTGELIEVYATVEEAAEDNYITPGNLRKVLCKQDGYMKKSKLRFRFAEG